MLGNKYTELPLTQHFCWLDFLSSTRHFQHHHSASFGLQLVCLATLCLLVGLLPAIAVNAEDLSTLDRGHRLLIQNGLQLMAIVDRNLTNTGNWENSNFTTIQFSDHQAASGGGIVGRISDLAELPDAQWSRLTWANEPHPNVIDAAESSNLSRLTMLQYRDEQNLANPAELTLATDTLAAWRTLYPDAIGYTNQGGGQFSSSTLSNYMQTAQPDMLFFDRYVFKGSAVPDKERGKLYKLMQNYRQLGLLGNDLTGNPSRLVCGRKTGSKTGTPPLGPKQTCSTSEPSHSG